MSYYNLIKKKYPRIFEKTECYNIPRHIPRFDALWLIAERLMKLGFREIKDTDLITETLDEAEDWLNSQEN